ncbi:torsin-1A-like isoform X2 [Oncorhynchus masou masou]|uniref:torsin-1A-like isoform X2 n=1 Tax=Oncorhynchus masou masou TaxID=90313 RepID=UPI0031836D38
MQATYATYFVYYVLISSGFVNAFEPISTTFVVGVGVGLAAVGRTIYNYVYESCDSKWIAFNSTGKNFASQLIAENIYKEGMASSCVHQFGTTHFLLSSQLENYKSQLQQWFKDNVTNCPRSMFIFKWMDQMHPGLIDCIKPYLGYYEYLDGVSYRQAIFIFLSNAGGEQITQVALDFWKAGRDREEIKLQHLEPALSLSVFNNKKSGLWHTRLIDKNLVDFFIPFLPLEYRHVLLCGMAEMSAKGLEPDQDVVDQMAKDMVYFPKSEKIFSLMGCKTISVKLDYYT